jgi:hypothetical protein
MTADSLNTNGHSNFRQLMEEVKFGHTSTEEAAARIDVYFEIALERALKARGVDTTVLNAEQRLFRDMHNFSKES